MQTVLCKRPLTTYNIYRERNCCTMHIAKVTDMCSRATIASFTCECQLFDFFILCLRRQYAATTAVTAATVIHARFQPTRGQSVFDGGFEVLRPSVRGTPLPTTYSEGLLLPVGASPCAPTYNHGVVQHVVFNRLGLAQPHKCSLKAATCHANSTVQAASNSI